MERKRYKCGVCGNDARFRALARFNNCEVIVDGGGRVIDPLADTQIIETEDCEVLDVRDCLVCGSTKVDLIKEREEPSSEQESG